MRQCMSTVAELHGQQHLCGYCYAMAHLECYTAVAWGNSIGIGAVERLHEDVSQDAVEQLQMETAQDECRIVAQGNSLRMGAVAQLHQAA